MHVYCLNIQPLFITEAWEHILHEYTLTQHAINVGPRAHKPSRRHLWLLFAPLAVPVTVTRTAACLA
jgi:hypothetical protein